MSLFFQGSRTGELPSVGIESLPVPEAVFDVTLDGRILNVTTDRRIEWLEIHDLQGRCLRRQRGEGAVDTSAWARGTYLISVEDSEGVITNRKIIL